MTFSDTKRFEDTAPAENSLIRRARAGSVEAFARLYDATVERVYRYVYFQTPSEGVANGITFQVFFRAWEQLDHFPMFGTSFVNWLYSLAQAQLDEYFQTHKNGVSPNRVSLTFRSQTFQDEVSDLLHIQALRDGMQVLSQEERQALILRFVLKLPNRSAARLMDRPQRESAGLQMRALRTLAGYLKEKELA